MCLLFICRFLPLHLACHYTFMKQLRTVLLVLLSVAAGCLFLYSALSKMFPIRSFEYTIMDTLHMPIMFATILARAIVGIEGALGLLIACHIYGPRKWPLKAALALTAVFTVYLAMLWAAKGDNINCGCFGDAIWMRPSVSIVKNVLLIGALWLLLKQHKGLQAGPRWLPPVAFWCSFLVIAVATLLAFPVMKPYKVDLSPLYTYDKRFVPNEDLTKGKHIVAFLSPSCTHCWKAARNMRRIKDKYPEVPFFIVIGGTESDLTEFWKETQATNLPYTRLSAEPIIKITGGAFPQIYMVNNSIVIEQLDYPFLDGASLAKWANSK